MVIGALGRLTVAATMIQMTNATGMKPQNRIFETRRAVRSCLVVALTFVSAITFVFLKRQTDNQILTNQCAGRLYQIGLGLRNYFERYGTYPPVSHMGTESDVLTSWRVAIIPTWIADEDFSNSYRYYEPWDSPHNLSAARHTYGDLYFCPTHPPSTPGKTVFLAVIGEGSFWSRVQSQGGHGLDELAMQRIVVLEVRISDVVWTEPRDITVEEALEVFSSNDQHGNGLHYLTAEGKVGSLGRVESIDKFRQLLTVPLQ